MFGFACKKTPTTTLNPQIVNFEMEVADTIIFDNLKSIKLPVKIKRTSGASSGDFTIRFESIDNQFIASTPTDLICPSDDFRNYDVSYTFKIEPGVYRATIKATQVNINNPESKTKTVYFVVRPSCAFNFKDYKSAKTVWVINGLTNYINVSCNYNLDNTLGVSGIATNFAHNLQFNCSNNTINVLPVTYNGNVYAGSGTFSAGKINLTMTYNGAYNGVVEITQ
jgi:hypothetical protein